jgi:uncharacterized protein YecE (DUF72 family)
VTKRREDDQLSFFAPLEPPPLPRVEAFVPEADRELAARLPRSVRLGTSSWAYPGWAGTMFAGAPSEAALAATGLRAYAENPLFRTVGIDRSYYRPLSVDELAAYAAQLPERFFAVSKIPRDLTTAVFADHPSHGALAGKRNVDFLDPTKVLDLVIAPYEKAFAPHAGPFLFELAPAPRGAVPPADDVVAAIDRLLAALPRRFSYAFEVRNRELLTADYFAVLRRYGAAHVFNFWTRMPTVGEQLEIPGALTARFAVARILLPPGARYDDNRERFGAFDRVVEPQLAMRSDVARLAHACVEGGRPLFVLVGNKAEGSAPWTVRALAEAISSPAALAAPASARRP